MTRIGPSVCTPRLLHRPAFFWPFVHINVSFPIDFVSTTISTINQLKGTQVHSRVRFLKTISLNPRATHARTSRRRQNKYSSSPHNFPFPFTFRWKPNIRCWWLRPSDSCSECRWRQNPTSRPLKANRQSENIQIIDCLYRLPCVSTTLRRLLKLK